MTINKRGIIEVTDPWEFVTIASLEFVPGTIEALTEFEATVRLDAPLTLDGHSMSVAHITSRHIGHNFALTCKLIPANVIFRSDEHYKFYQATGTLSVE